MSPRNAPPARSQRCNLSHWRLLLLCALCALGCASPEREKVRLEAYSWWTRASEKNAFAQVLDIYNLHHDDAEVVNQVTETSNANEVRATLTARLLAGAPPSTFQANAGADLLRWTAVDTAAAVPTSESRIAPLDGLFRRTGLDEVLPSDLYKALQAGREPLPYAVPLNIHRLNLIYYNTAALRRYQERHTGESFLKLSVLCPESIDELLSDPKQKLDLKIAVGLRDSFTLTLFALENVLPAIAGTDVYDDATGGTLYDELLRGKLAEQSWRGPVRRALQCVQYLSRSFIDNRNKSWAEALNQVAQGEADFSVMGDWANGELKSALASQQVDAQPFPGSEGTFVFTSDTFPLPVAAPYAKESEAFLATLATSDAQLAFSREKGSIPARSDITLETVRAELGERAAQARLDFDSLDVHKSIATSGLFPPYYPDQQLSTLLTTMTAAGASQKSIEDVIALLRNTLPLLERWQKRIVEGQQTP
jgi:glucose/mannose transport system substrate-binding protein